MYYFAIIGYWLFTTNLLQKILTDTEKKEDFEKLTERPDGDTFYFITEN